MKLVLNENIRGLGSTGDVVTVKDGYGRNYLLPKKLAIYPTEGNLHRLRKAREEYLVRESDHIDAARLIAGKVAAKLEGAELTVSMKANDAGQLFGSVTEAILATNLGGLIEVELHEKQIIMGSHWKRIGEYVAVVRLHSEVEVEFPVHVLAEAPTPEVVAEEATENAEGDEAEAATDGAEEVTAEANEEEKTEE